MINKISPPLINPKYNNTSAHKPYHPAFKGADAAKPVSKLAKFFAENKKAQRVLEFATDHNLLFGASFAIIITCLLRPTSIMILPSKKNKDDQKYAAAQSIGSGIIGFGLSTLIFTPFEKAAKNVKAAINKDPNALIKDGSSYLLKNKKNIANATTILDRLPDVVFAAPKGILTVALIPPILKYVFGMEKKKDKPKQDFIQPPIYYGTINFKSTTSKNKTVFDNFNGGVR